MAFDQGFSQGPQRPYNGPAAPRFAPRRNFVNPSQQPYDHYQDNGYPNENVAFPQGRQTYSNSGWRNDYPQNQRYNPPPQQPQYNGGRRGPPPSRGRGVYAPIRQPASIDGMRGGYDERRPPEQRKRYPDGSTGRVMTNPLDMEKPGSVDQGTNLDAFMEIIADKLAVRMQARRKPVNSPLTSPNQTAWDNPFPTFPGAQKKTAQSEEQEILRKMAAMEIGGSRVDSRNDAERPAVDNSKPGPFPKKKNLQGPSQQEYIEPRQGLLGPRYGSSVRNKVPIDPNLNGMEYRRAPEPSNHESYGIHNSRNAMLRSETPLQKSRTPVPPNADNFDFRSFTPGVGLAPRGPGTKSTAPDYQMPPEREHSSQVRPMDPNIDGEGAPLTIPQHDGSLGDLYSDYYQIENLDRRSSPDIELPNFDIGPGGFPIKGDSFELHMQAPSHNPDKYGEIDHLNPQFDVLAHSYEPQSTAPINVGNAPPVPNEYDYAFDNGYGNDPSSFNQGFGPPSNYDGYHESQYPYTFEAPPQNNFQLPPGSASASMYQGYGGFQNAQSDEFAVPPSGSYPHYMPDQAQEDDYSVVSRAEPSYSSAVGQFNPKPVPMRNYSNVAPTQQSPGEFFQDGASSGTEATTVTVAELDYLRNTIKLNPTDQASQLLLARRLVDASEVLVQPIPDQRARNKARERYVMDAHKLLKKLVTLQNPDAMFFLADCYGRGALGLETDYKEAFSLYQSAAKVGHAAAAYRTAVCCELGNEEGGGTRKDPLKATQWYRRAAMLGDTPAMYKMGIVLLKGLLGQPRNPREAIGWLKRAAERADAENPHALHELALLYEQPQGSETSVIRDEAYSFQLFQQAADLGYKFSQFRLGCAYEYGLFNCPIDPRLSILWYSRAAAQGEHQSELALSGWYLTGSEGVMQQNDTEAYLWARKAAMAGLAKAEYAMGYFTEVGIGSPGNLEDAKRWYWRAAAQNFPKARERLEDLKRGGSKATLRPREKISRSKVGKQNEGECTVM